MVAQPDNERWCRKHPAAVCEECPLYNLGDYVPSKWVPNSDIVFVGEAPGAQEVRDGEPFVGESGQLLGRAIRAAGGDPSAVSKANVVACQPPGNNLNMYPEAVACCTPRLMRELEEFEGKKIVALGKIATEVVLGDIAERPVEAQLPPSARRARWFEADETSVIAGAQVLSEYHPAYVARKPAEMPGFKKGIARVFAKDNGILLQKPEVVVLSSFEEVRECLDRVPDGTWVAFDLETNQVQYYDRKYSKDKRGNLIDEEQPADEILLVSMAWNLKRGYVIDGMLLYDDERLAPYLTDFFARVKTVAHNGKFDVVFLKTVGVKARVDFDTMLAHFVLEETLPHGLKILAQDEYGLPNYEAVIIQEYLNNSNDWYSKIPFDKLALYAVWDVIVTRALKERFEKRLRARPAFGEGFQDVITCEETRGATAYDWPFMNLLMPAQHFLSDTEFNGIGVDEPYLMRASQSMELELNDHVRTLREMCGKPDFNPNAPMQVADVLYNDRGIPRPRALSRSLGRRIVKGNSKNPENCTDKGVLDAIIELTDDEWAKKLKAYRRVAKIKSSYVDNMLGYVDTRGRVHADFRVMGTEVGRLALREPALQTIPRPKDRHGQIIRGAFIAQPYTNDELQSYFFKGQRFWDLIGLPLPDPTTLRDEDVEAVLIISDYNQAELCCAAHYSDEPFLIRVYRDGRDLHDEGTYAMFGTPEDLALKYRISIDEARVMWKELRVQVKMFNFAYLYGGNENSFAQDSGIPVRQAKEFVHTYESNMPYLAQWKKDQYRRALKYHYVVTVHGRRRTFPELAGITAESMYHQENRKILDDVRKASVHAVVAGTASDLCLLSASELAGWGLEVELLVHDSIIIRAPRFMAEAIEQRVPEVMISTASKWMPRVTWRVDTKTSKRWAKPPADLLEAA